MLESLIIAFSTFSKIPMPHIGWTKKGMRYSICFFPLVGAAAGAAEWLLFWLGGVMPEDRPFPVLLAPALLTAAPLLISGGIHLDGFLDTTDALLSYRNREEKAAILKDPHVGAFAVIYGMLYVLLSFGLFTAVNRDAMRPVCAGFVLSRAMSGYALMAFPKARKDGMLRAEADNSAGSVKTVMFMEMLAASAAVLALNPMTGGAVLAAAYLTLLLYHHVAMKEFGGVSGDLAGWFLSLCELLMLGAAVTAGMIIG